MAGISKDSKVCSLKSRGVSSKPSGSRIGSPNSGGMLSMNIPPPTKVPTMWWKYSLRLLWILLGFNTFLSSWLSSGSTTPTPPSISSPSASSISTSSSLSTSSSSYDLTLIVKNPKRRIKSI